MTTTTVEAATATAATVKATATAHPASVETSARRRGEAARCTVTLSGCCVTTRSAIGLAGLSKAASATIKAGLCEVAGSVVGGPGAIE